MSTAAAARLLPDEALQRGRVVAILRATNGRHLRTTAETLVQTGVGCLEVTMNTPGALETVCALRAELWRRTWRAWASGRSVPSTRSTTGSSRGRELRRLPRHECTVGRRAAELGLRWYPGAATATEVEVAWELGATAVKIFPAGSLGGPGLPARAPWATG